MTSTWPCEQPSRQHWRGLFVTVVAVAGLCTGTTAAAAEPPQETPSLGGRICEELARQGYGTLERGYHRPPADLMQRVTEPAIEFYARAQLAQEEADAVARKLVTAIPRATLEGLPIAIGGYNPNTELLTLTIQAHLSDFNRPRRTLRATMPSKDVRLNRADPASCDVAWTQPTLAIQMRLCAPPSEAEGLLAARADGRLSADVEVVLESSETCEDVNARQVRREIENALNRMASIPNLVGAGYVPRLAIFVRVDRAVLRLDGQPVHRLGRAPLFTRE